MLPGTEGLDITPRDGAEAARRSYADTVRLWNSRFLPALVHWTGLGRLSEETADRLRALPVSQQVSEVLELERDRIFFSKDLSKSVLYSIAAPGTSQHIAMLAFDANEFLDARVRTNSGRKWLVSDGFERSAALYLSRFSRAGIARPRTKIGRSERSKVLDSGCRVKCTGIRSPTGQHLEHLVRFAGRYRFS